MINVKFYDQYDWINSVKVPHDADIPLNPETPKDLNKTLKEHKLKEKFESLAPSTKRTFLRWLFKAKQKFFALHSIIEK